MQLPLELADVFTHNDHIKILQSPNQCLIGKAKCSSLENKYGHQLESFLKQRQDKAENTVKRIYQYVN